MDQTPKDPKENDSPETVQLSFHEIDSLMAHIDDQLFVLTDLRKRIEANNLEVGLSKSGLASISDFVVKMHRIFGVDIIISEMPDKKLVNKANNILGNTLVLMISILSYFIFFYKK